MTARHALLVIIALACVLPGGLARAQNPTVLEVSRFPEDYSGTITFPNIWWYPVLRNVKDDNTKREYFSVQLSASDGETTKNFEAMGALSKVRSVVGKAIAKQLAADGFGGYEYHYFGDVTGRLIKAKTFGSEYLFIITRIVYHNPEGEVIRVYQ